MQMIDWWVMGGYLMAMLFLAIYIGRKQRSSDDYFLGGRKLSAPALAASTLATQCSSNSLLGAPAFVGFAAGGGLVWLQYELAVPLAMLALIWLMVPARQAGITSIYEILELNLGRTTRLTASLCFMIFLGVATGAAIYGSALVLSLILEVSLLFSVFLMMFGTLIYDLLGGLAAVVISDVIQLLLLIATVCVSLVVLGDMTSWNFLVAERSATLVNDWGVNGNDYGFWPMLFGGFILYAAYYGCDQSQAQRILATESEADTKRVLLLNGLLRFPLVLAYCGLGLGLSALALQDSSWLSALPGFASGTPNYNLVFPVFVLEHFAPGFVGLVMVGLLAAAMSSIDSAINSLAAVTMEDFIKPRLSSDTAPGKLLAYSRLCTVFWATLILLFAFQVDAIAPTILEAVNKVGSMVNGPLLALICLAIFAKKVGQVGALGGFAVGLAANFTTAFLLPQVSWLWWNVVGFLSALLAAAFIYGLLNMQRGEGMLAIYNVNDKGQVTARRETRLLLGMFGVILLACLALQLASNSFLGQ